MEQKRTLWIIAAVGVFLLVVLGAALVLYSPAARVSQTIAVGGTDKGSSSNGWISLAPASPVKQPQDSLLPEIKTEIEETARTDYEALPEPDNTDFETKKIGELTVYADNATIYSGNTTDVPPAMKNNTTTIDLTDLTAAAPAEKETIPAEIPAAQKPARVSETVTQKKTPVRTEKPAVAKKNAVEKAAKPAAAPKAVEQTQYWVQVTALTSKKSADNARELLAENKITADVFTYTDAKGRLFYRVRVGPYTTKSEAEYWQSKISAIDSFKSTSSYVASTKVAMN